MVGHEITRLVVERVTPIDGVDDLDAVGLQVRDLKDIGQARRTDDEDLTVTRAAVKRLLHPVHSHRDVDGAAWAPGVGADEHEFSLGVG